jgi:DNA-binding transcriptional ArsR family regulator
LALDVLGLVGESSRGLTVTEISEKLSKTPPSISRVLSKLLREGLVESVSVGRNKFFKVKSDKNELVRKLIEDSVKVAARLPVFKIISLESNVTSILVRELKEAVGKELEISTETSISGMHLDHSFDILLRDSKTLAIEIVHCSKVSWLFERFGRWHDLRRTDLELIILVVLGVIKQPFRSFFESIGKEYKPQTETIFVDIAELDEKTVRQKIAKPIIEMITNLLRPRQLRSSTRDSF